MAKEKTYDFTDPNHPNPLMNGWREYIRPFNEYFKQQMAVSDNLPDGLHVGKIFSTNVADGAAYYQIEKLYKNLVQLVWRWELSLDKYADRHFGKGGIFSKSDVEKYVSQEDTLKRVFGGKKEFGV